VVIEPEVDPETKAGSVEKRIVEEGVVEAVSAVIVELLQPVERKGVPGARHVDVESRIAEERIAKDRFVVPRIAMVDLSEQAQLIPVGLSANQPIPACLVQIPHGVLFRVTIVHFFDWLFRS
jgi:hypothetical protein